MEKLHICLIFFSKSLWKYYICPIFSLWKFPYFPYFFSNCPVDSLHFNHVYFQRVVLFLTIILFLTIKIIRIWNLLLLLVTVKNVFTHLSERYISKLSESMEDLCMCLYRRWVARVFGRCPVLSRPASPWCLDLKSSETKLLI